MAKRYGRNQRRRHRERIAELEARVHATTVSIRDRTTELLELRRKVELWDAEIRHLLGEPTAFRFEPSDGDYGIGRVYQQQPPALRGGTVEPYARGAGG